MVLPYECDDCGFPPEECDCEGVAQSYAPCTRNHPECGAWHVISNDPQTDEV